MPWVIQLNGRDLETVEEINGLRDVEIKRLRLRVVNPHFNRDEIMRLINVCRDRNGSTKSVCRKIERALEAEVFNFDVFRQISGWLRTSKKSDENLEEIIRELFYDEVFDRFTTYNNQGLVNNFRGIFLPWLVQVFFHGH
jgi:hypothetical protein